jgi:hypothetical protein
VAFHLPLEGVKNKYIGTLKGDGLEKVAKAVTPAPVLRNSYATEGGKAGV